MNLWNSEPQSRFDGQIALDQALRVAMRNRHAVRRISIAKRSAVTLVAFLLGIWGFTKQYAGPIGATEALQIVYQTFQLLTLNMVPIKEMSWQLQVARISLPLLLAYATVTMYLDMAHRSLLTLRDVRRADHIIVVGGGKRAVEAVKRCMAEGVPTVLVLSHSDREDLTQFGVAFVTGDLASSATYVRAGISKTVSVLIMSNSDGTNLRALMAVRMAAQEKRPKTASPLFVACEINDREMADTFKAALGEWRDTQVEVHIIDFSDGVARQFAVKLAPLLARRKAPSFVVFGDGALARAIVRRLLINGAEGTRIRIAGPDSQTMVAAIHASAPGIADRRFITPIEAGWGGNCLECGPMANALKENHPDAMLLCPQADEVGIVASLVVVRRIPRSFPVHVHQKGG